MNKSLIYILLTVFSSIFIFSIECTNGYFMLTDDAMISMRYAYNLVHGNGLVWNPVEYVQGFTNLGFTLIMSVVHILNLPLNLNSLIIQILNLVILLVIIYFVYHKEGLIPSVLIAISGPMFFWGLWGMESNLQALLILIAYYSKRNLLWLALAFVVRADGLIFFLLGMFLIKDKRDVIWYGLIVLAVFFFQYFYYGDWFPNTYYLKVDGENGFDYLGKFLFKEFFYAPIYIGAIGYSIYKKEIKSLVYIVGWTFYLLYIGEDAFDFNRFFIPIIPIICIMFARMIKENYRKNLILIPLIILISIHVYFRFTVEIKNDKKENYIEVIKELEKYPQDYLIATFYAGIIPYFLPEYRFHDMLGKNDKHIARTKIKNGKVGHNKWDYDYSFSLKPNIVVTASNFEPYTDKIALWYVSHKYDWAFHPALYLHPNFRNNYEYVSGSFRQIYKRNYETSQFLKK